MSKPSPFTEKSFENIRLYQYSTVSGVYMWSAVLKKEKAEAYGATPAAAVALLWKEMKRLRELEKRILKSGQKRNLPQTARIKAEVKGE